MGLLKHEVVTKKTAETRKGLLSGAGRPRARAAGPRCPRSPVQTKGSPLPRARLRLWEKRPPGPPKALILRGGGGHRQRQALRSEAAALESGGPRGGPCPRLPRTLGPWHPLRPHGVPFLCTGDSTSRRCPGPAAHDVQAHGAARNTGPPPPRAARAGTRTPPGPRWTPRLLLREPPRAPGPPCPHARRWRSQRNGVGRPRSPWTLAQGRYALSAHRMTQVASDKATLGATHGGVPVSVLGGGQARGPLRPGGRPGRLCSRRAVGPAVGWAMGDTRTVARAPQPGREAPRAGTFPALADVPTPATAPSGRASLRFSQEEVRAPWGARGPLRAVQCEVRVMPKSAKLTAASGFCGAPATAPGPLFRHLFEFERIHA